MPVVETSEPLVALPASFGPVRARVRSGIAERLLSAADLLPEGVALRVVEGHRTARSQRAIIDRYTAELRALDPELGAEELRRLTSRFVSPIEVAPHVAGAAVDLTLVDGRGRELDLGTAIDATPEKSHGACYFDAPGIGPDAAGNRGILARALSEAGLVNYPTEWWHWSFGDRYWALVTGAPAARYGPIVEAASDPSAPTAAAAEAAA